jgi:hypothetical protein
MATKADLPVWVETAIKANRDSARCIEIAKYMWDNQESEFHRSSDLFISGNTICDGQLSNSGVMKQVAASPTGVWELA